MNVFRNPDIVGSVQANLRCIESSQRLLYSQSVCYNEVYLYMMQYLHL